MNKKTIMLGFIFLVLTGWMIGCTKCSVPQKMVKEELSPEDLAKQLAPAICEKYGSCRPEEGFQKEQCLQDVEGGLVNRLKEMKDLKLGQTALDACLKAVREATCDILTSPTPPVGCEFLQ